MPFGDEENSRFDKHNVTLLMLLMIKRSKRLNLDVDSNRENKPRAFIYLTFNNFPAIMGGWIWRDEGLLEKTSDGC